MNFLAHAWLAGEDDALVVGGVVGDWIKGVLPGTLPPDLARGVALHRALDQHAESHPAFNSSRARIPADRRRYAGVLVDIYYDHLLARHWAAFHAQPLHDFCAEIYRRIKGRLDDLPHAAHPALRMMAREDWLSSYARIEGIADVLARMSCRARQPNPLCGGELAFLADASGFEQDFRAWKADALVFCQNWRAAHRIGQ
jgi:acyl carrier protein phosphodiesterase